ncbi:MAG TPA: single-stranded-DNA-specific exonuclease RecJ [Gemmataceae bacterium]|nr:single-stranded-DNA-specific exonuclease RecJ [Gemmataceae bacterium]
MRLAKTWHLLPHDRTAVERLASQLSIAPIVAQLLLNRRLEAAENAKRFLDAPLSGLHPPNLLPGISEAADRLLAAVKDNRRICVYGDYDVDGITGSSILLQGLRLLGAQPDFYVPHRLEEGYGLNSGALRQLAASGIKVVVTVDCGIASLEEAEEAKRLGLELIITDHHEPRDTLPDAAVLVHPRLPDGVYPFGHLSGAGVALKLAWALSQRACGSEKVTPRFRDYLMDAVALASLGTVADVVPLHDENRILVRHGLVRIKQAPSVGLQALIEATGFTNGSSLRAYDIGFRLAPRLNAAGRLGCARLVIELLTTNSPQRAKDLARYLEEQNQERQKIERRMLVQAKEMMTADDFQSPAIVLANADWHVGVLGIVASRLVDLYARPALLIAMRTESGEGTIIGQGSGRSVADFPLNEALKICTEHLLSHGGHHMAAGFKLHPDRIDDFRKAFMAQAALKFPLGPPAPRLTLDAETPLGSLTVGLLRDIDRLEPYGSANNRPIFLAGGLQVNGEPRKMGNGERHFHFRVRQGDVQLRAVAFGLAERLDELMSAQGQCCLAFTPKINEWQGRRNVELEVIDFQAGAEARLG